MILLSRKPAECLMLGDDLLIALLELTADAATVRMTHKRHPPTDHFLRLRDSLHLAPDSVLTVREIQADKAIFAFTLADPAALSRKEIYDKLHAPR